MDHNDIWSMPKKPFPPPYVLLTELLVGVRKSAGLSQVELADRLSIGQSAVSKVERGVQGLDLVELHRWLGAIGTLSLGDFAKSFDEQVSAQTAAGKKWKRTGPRVGRPARGAGK